jgi:hypothetical protein
VKGIHPKRFKIEIRILAIFTDLRIIRKEYFMAAIDDYKLQLQKELNDVEYVLYELDKKKKSAHKIIATIIGGIYIFLWVTVFLQSKYFDKMLFLIGFYGTAFVILLMTVFGDILAKKFVDGYYKYPYLELEKKDLDERISIVGRAIYLLERLKIDELPIKREIDRTNLLGFKKSLDEIAFRNYSDYEFRSNIYDPCSKILYRIANYSTNNKKSPKNNDTLTTTTATSPAKQALQTVPNAIPKAKVISFITNLASLFTPEKPEIKERNLIHSREVNAPPPDKKDYFKISETNAELGLQGELFVIEQEKNRLSDLKRKDLAEKVIHVSKNEGDCFGYDIISYDDSGNEKYIEVKTTLFGFNSNFYLTNNELFTLNQNGYYFIYRVYNFDLERKNGSIYIIDLLNGDLLNYFKMEPILYKIWPNKIHS